MKKRCEVTARRSETVTHSSQLFRTTLSSTAFKEPLSLSSDQGNRHAQLAQLAALSSRFNLIFLCVAVSPLMTCVGVFGNQSILHAADFI